MTPLLFITAALMLASGLVKLRAAARIGLGVHLLSLLELLTCAVLSAVAVGGVATPEAGLAFVAAAVVLLVASSVHLGARLGAYRKQREASQARRLETYLLYLSGAAPDATGAPPSDEARDVHRPDPR